MPNRRAWRRNMPVKPASARTVIRTFAVSRTAISAVTRCATSAGGWLIWTPMKMAPAAAAHRPAAEVRRAGVTSALAAHRGTPMPFVGYVLLVLAGLVLVGRRRFPVTVLAATYGLTLAYRGGDDPSGAIWLAVVIAFGTAIYLRKRIAALA